MNTQLSISWKKTIYYECPVCFNGQTVEKEVLGTKPENPQAWSEYVERYDFCDEPQPDPHE